MDMTKIKDRLPLALMVILLGTCIWVVQDKLITPITCNPYEADYTESFSFDDPQTGHTLDPHNFCIAIYLLPNRSIWDSTPIMGSELEWYQNLTGDEDLTYYMMQPIGSACYLHINGSKIVFLAKAVDPEDHYWPDYSLTEFEMLRKPTNITMTHLAKNQTIHYLAVDLENGGLPLRGLGEDLNFDENLDSIEWGLTLTVNRSLFLNRSWEIAQYHGQLIMTNGLGSFYDMDEAAFTLTGGVYIENNLNWTEDQTSDGNPLSNLGVTTLLENNRSYGWEYNSNCSLLIIRSYTPWDSLTDSYLWNLSNLPLISASFWYQTESNILASVFC